MFDVACYKVRRVNKKLFEDSHAKIYMPVNLAGGETLTLACAIGLVFLLLTKIANYRMVVGCLLGMIIFSSFLNWVGSDTNPMFSMPWY